MTELSLCKQVPFSQDEVSNPVGKAAKYVKLLEYLSNPGNPWMERQTLATEVLGYSRPQSLWNLFNAHELNEIEGQALEIRRKRCAGLSARIDDALVKEALAGNVAAIKLYYKRIENWSEQQDLEHAEEEMPNITISKRV